LGWGALSEDKVAGSLLTSGLLEKWKMTGEVKLFDPFCGSGSILIESLLSALEVPIREVDMRYEDGVMALEGPKKELVERRVEGENSIAKFEYKDTVKSAVKSIMNWPVFEPGMYEELKKELLETSEAKKSEMKFSVIGCDLNRGQLMNFSKNLEVLDINGVTKGMQSLDPNAVFFFNNQKR
jgi:23S rRNA G2445 N2-methylase RlmL